MHNVNNQLFVFLYLQKWAHASRDMAYVAVDTNNGTESLNKALKYSYPPKQKSLSLTSIASLLIDRFLPDMYQKYIFQNCKLSEEYRAYNDSIKTHGRVSAAKKPCDSQSVLFTGTANSPFSAPHISITTGPISIKFTYFMPSIYATLHTKFERNRPSSLRDTYS